LFWEGGPPIWGHGKTGESRLVVLTGQGKRTYVKAERNVLRPGRMRVALVIFWEMGFNLGGNKVDLFTSSSGFLGNYLSGGGAS